MLLCLAGNRVLNHLLGWWLPAYDFQCNCLTWNDFSLASAQFSLSLHTQNTVAGAIALQTCLGLCSGSKVAANKTYISAVMKFQYFLWKLNLCTPQFVFAAFTCTECFQHLTGQKAFKRSLRSSDGFSETSSISHCDDLDKLDQRPPNLSPGQEQGPLEMEGEEEQKEVAQAKTDTEDIHSDKSPPDCTKVEDQASQRWNPVWISDCAEEAPAQGGRVVMMHWTHEQCHTQYSNNYCNLLTGILHKYTFPSLGQRFVLLYTCYSCFNPLHVGVTKAVVKFMKCSWTFVGSYPSCRNPRMTSC